MASCSPDSEAMGFLLQITMSCPRALSRQVAGAGCRCWCWCCELAVHVCWVPGAGAGAVSWLCTWWRRRVPVLVHVVGAGCWCWCWCCELAVHVVETGSWCWCRAPVLVLGAGRRCWCCELAAQVVETGCWRWCRAGAGAGCRAPVLALVL